MVSEIYLPAVAGIRNPLHEGLNRREIPSLSGLRGLAAVLVVFYHIFSKWKWERWWPGDESVVIFFELSGLLITWLLLRERRETGSIHLRQFYERRALRIFPAYYVLWFLCLVVPDAAARWWSFFYLSDVINAIRIWFPVMGGVVNVLGMTWSLSVEEKYYLLWPVILRSLTPRKLLQWIVPLAVIDQAYHLLVFAAGHESWAAFGFETRLDGLLLGSALAIAVHEGWKPFPWLLHPATLVASLVCVEALAAPAWHFRLGWGVTLGAYPLLIILIYVISKPPRLLNNPVAKFFGNISYSLYLYHLLVIYLLDSVHFTRMRWEVGSKITLSVAAATLSYYLVEQPFLRWKNRLHPRAKNTLHKAVAAGGA
ncbi:MAG TPA: acyltransferase [Bryobacteraceae bacterium]|nr:acyltransferase [Bryobacteraceae bacterium]